MERCSKCGWYCEAGAGWCRFCRKAYCTANRAWHLLIGKIYPRSRPTGERARQMVQDWRKRNLKTYNSKPEIRFKNAARQKAYQALRRGELIRQPCKQCGNSETEMHHPDYSQPLLVEWLCTACHGKTRRNRINF